MSAPRLLTERAWDRLEEVAALKARIPEYKLLAIEVGISQTYLKNLMSRIVRLKKAGLPVPRETRLRSHITNGELDQFAADLMRK